MIEDPPLLQMRRKFPRPTAAQAAALRGAQTGNIVDCMDGRGALIAAIKPLDPDCASFCGPAVTCHAYPADNLGVFAGLDLIQDGDVLVCANDGCRETAVVGDLVIGMLRNRGGIAFVTDGMVRDQDGIRPVGLPVFSAGVTPNSPARTGPGTGGLPVNMAGRTINAGDLIVGDRDGVVIVPYAIIDLVIDRLAAVRKVEIEMAAKVEAGAQAPTFLAELFGSSKVVEVD